MMNTENSPLNGIRIADFTIHAAGPFCTHLLSQLGAECIKIESNQRLDAFRKPHAVYGRLTAATFDQVASNKLSVRLNLKKAEGVALAKRIVSISDMAAASFRPGVLEKLGLDFDSLVKVKPDLVMVCLSACGQTGPDSHFGGYAPLFGAWGGLGTMSGYQDGPPLEMRHVMDHSVGLHAAFAAIGALRQSKKTGSCQLVDVAAREIASAMIGESLLMASLGYEPTRVGNSDLCMSPHGVYATRVADRWLTLAISTQDQWLDFLEIIGKSNDDLMMKDVSTRQNNKDYVDAQVQQWLLMFDADQLVIRLQEKNVPAHVSWNMQDIADDKHLRQRRAVVDVADEKIPKRPVVGQMASFSNTNNVGLRRLTPELGEDEDYVFGELLKLTRSQRDDFEEREVIF